MNTANRGPRSKTLAAWLALLVGASGLHRVYLYGWRDIVAWLHPVPTLVGLAGVVRMRNLGQDDRIAWLLIPVLGAMLSAGALTAIVWALMPDERWDERHNGGVNTRPGRWGAVLAAVVGLLLGGMVLMGTITFALQKFFEWQLGPPGS
ncbi:MAG TPA: hypothetical protein VK439_04345 [Rubrivivax sp.]|nr:hypothetical protein [Rubrivivax sp.]